VSNILITGGLGFIGTFIADRHLERGDNVTIVDSAVGAVVDESEYSSHPNCTVHVESVEDHFAGGADLSSFDRVVHAAAHVGPAGILRYSGQLGYAIVASTQMVVDACVAAGVPLCVFSSAEVYGRSGLLAESDAIQVPVDYNARIEYAIAKTLTEAITVNSLSRGLRGIVIRPFNVAGPRQSRAGGFVMPTFVQQAQAGKPMTVFATGRQVRAFVSAVDLARFVCDHWDAAFNSGRHIFNIGNPDNRIPVEDLAVRIKELLGSGSLITHVDARTIHGPMYVEAESFEKVPVLAAAPAVGWKPEVGLDDLILETAEYYRKRRDTRGANAPL
jgi:nucleoside-diphosphate-sugar epimerase